MCFGIIWLLAILVPMVYVFLVGRAAYKGREVDERSRDNYFESVRTMVTAAGVAIAIVAAGFQQKIVGPIWIAKKATVALGLSVVFSVTTMLEMSRSYEEARASRRIPVKWTKLIPILVLGYFALASFFLGFAYLVRLIFYM